MSSNVHDFPAPGRKIQESNTDPESLPLLPDEKLVLKAYLKSRKHESDEVQEACTRMKVPNKGLECTRLQAAVAQVLLHDVQRRLPAWSGWDGTQFVSARTLGKRGTGQTLALMPQHLFTLNWADSGPGFSWPDAYHSVYVPGYECCVVTASQDSDECWGCTDQAIGFFPAGDDNDDGVRRVICTHWRRLRRNLDHSAWCYLFAEGLVSDETARQWRQRVWGRNWKL